MGNEGDSCAVKVAVRERPVRDSLKSSTEQSVVSYHPNSNILVVDERPFTFDHVLGPTVSQSQVFDDLVRPLVAHFKRGFNCTALAYGQTGTGKSYTMGLDSVNFDGEHIGVIPRCLKEIFTDGGMSSEIKENLADAPLKAIELAASFIEIYNEKVYDLLAENSTEAIVAKGYRYTGGSRKPLGCLLDCYAILMQGNKNRHVRPTKMNSQSSRSHAIFTIHLHSKSLTANSKESKIYSCMNIVDLAGSEGVRRTGHQGVAMSEGVNINQGLLSIGKVLQAMTVGSKVIPYRDSVLSSVLQDSLNSNSYLTLLACISPHREDLSETLSTLRFAQNAKQLKNTPQINNIIADIKRNAKTKQTPFKVKPLQTNKASKATPFKRTHLGVSGVMAKSAIKSNTFCTPKKLRMDVNKCNQTEIIGTSKRHKLSNIAMNLPNMGQLESTHNRESIFNRSLDLNTSMSGLNISTSTAVDGAASKSSNNNFSPVIRKCFSEFETGLEKKLLEIMQRNIHTFVVPQTPVIVPQTETPFSLTMRHEIKTIMKELLSEKSEKVNTPLKVNAKCQLFNSSADIFKIPDIPGNTGAPKTSSPNSENDSQISFTQTFFSGAMDTDRNVLNKSIRRSMRLSRQFVNEKSLHINNSFVPNDNRNSTIRRSTRKSVIQKFHGDVRKACKLECCHSPWTEQKIQPQPKPANSKRKNVSSTTSVSETSKTNTTLIDNCCTGSSLAKHKKAILELLNKGSRKELQVLPMIGQKKAFQIITHRTLHGKLKNLGQVQKLPFWRGKEWDRFAAANYLL